MSGNAYRKWLASPWDWDRETAEAAFKGYIEEIEANADAMKRALWALTGGGQTTKVSPVVVDHQIEVVELADGSIMINGPK